MHFAKAKQSKSRAKQSRAKHDRYLLYSVSDSLPNSTERNLRVAKCLQFSVGKVGEVLCTKDELIQMDVQPILIDCPSILQWCKIHRFRSFFSLASFTSHHQTLWIWFGILDSRFLSTKDVILLIDRSRSRGVGTGEDQRIWWWECRCQNSLPLPHAPWDFYPPSSTEHSCEAVTPLNNLLPRPPYCIKNLKTSFAPPETRFADRCGRLWWW